MLLKDYYPTLSPKERQELAKKVRVSAGHLRNAIYGAPISAAAVARLELATQGKVTRKAHFPDTYTEIWPELASNRTNKTAA